MSVINRLGKFVIWLLCLLIVIIVYIIYFILGFLSIFKENMEDVEKEREGNSRLEQEQEKGCFSAESEEMKETREEI